VDSVTSKVQKEGKKRESRLTKRKAVGGNAKGCSGQVTPLIVSGLII
jgi:hypothetical protein